MPNPINILIADDDTVFRKLIEDIVAKLGYKALTASDGREAIEIFFATKNIKLCILDVMMPIYDGWEVLTEIRQKSDVPVMMLTALGDERNEVKGLTKGADDYIAKPFSYPVFIARIEALLRKSKQEVQENIIAGEISIDTAIHKVYIKNAEIILNHKEFQLLFYLIKNQGILLDRDKILDEIWGFDFQGDFRTVDTHIKMLRQKLGRGSKYIITIRGFGYKFEVNNDEK